MVLLAPCLSDRTSDAVSHVWPISKQHHRMKFKQGRCSDTGLCWLDLQGKAEVRSESPAVGLPSLPDWTPLSPTPLLWLVCCPFALRCSFLPLPLTRAFVFICGPCSLPALCWFAAFAFVSVLSGITNDLRLPLGWGSLANTTVFRVSVVTLEEERSAENLGRRMGLIGLMSSGTVEFIIGLQPGFSFLPWRCMEL